MFQAAAHISSEAPADFAAGAAASNAAELTTQGGSVAQAFSDLMTTNTNPATQFNPSEGLEMLSSAVASAGVDLMAAALQTENLPAHDGSLDVGEVLHEVGAALEFVSAFDTPLADLTGPFVIHTGRVLGRLLETSDEQQSEPGETSSSSTALQKAA